MQGNREFYSSNWASKNFVMPFSNDASITLMIGKINVDSNSSTGITYREFK
ncbi:MAG: hypothetical protein LBF97_06825 [Elusimicrobiota bacterium]|jgi:hypothetical protein|nr:hypothetical protein [Elusimicrobiota bacterium]